MAENRGTHRTVTASDLSQQVRDYYRDYFARRPDVRGEFEHALMAVWSDLLAAAGYGCDAGFLLHVLVNTRFHRVTPNAARSNTLRTLSVRQRAELMRGLRAFQGLGEARLAEIFGPAVEWARYVWSGNQFLYHELQAVTVAAPAFGAGSRVPLTGRRGQSAVTACIICLLAGLKACPKPLEVAVVLMTKFGVVNGNADTATIAFVKKRAQRAKPAAADPHSAISKWIGLFSSSYAWLSECLRSPSLLAGPSPEAVRE